MTEKTYSHIAIEPDDDEIVISAGVQTFPAVPVSAPVADPAPAPEPVVAPAPEPVATPEPAPVPQKAQRTKEAYHETTLEDLESVQLSGMQKGIMIAAGIGAVAAVVLLIVYFV